MPAANTTRIGVRELRQNASRYLERVRAGEAIEITARGHVVAARRVLGGLHLVDVTREILERTGTLRTKVRLRTLDAVHLVTAMAGSR